MLDPKTIPMGGADCWFIESFLPAETSDISMTVLSQELPWKQDSIQLFGRSVAIPRLQTFMGDKGVTYTYSGLSLDALPWHAEVWTIKQALEKYTGHEFNAVLLNLYRDGQDSMGWHQDNEPELGIDPIVASISLGTERRFLFRHKHDKQNKVEINLTHGSLLWMGSGVQSVWQHSVPKMQRCHCPRINLTFRQVQSS